MGATGVAVVPPVPPVAGGVLGVTVPELVSPVVSVFLFAFDRSVLGVLTVGLPPTPRSDGVLFGRRVAAARARDHDDQQDQEDEAAGDRPRRAAPAPVDELGLTPGGRPARAAAAGDG